MAQSQNDRGKPLIKWSAEMPRTCLMILSFEPTHSVDCDVTNNDGPNNIDEEKRICDVRNRNDNVVRPCRIDQVVGFIIYVRLFRFLFRQSSFLFLFAVRRFLRNNSDKACVSQTETVRQTDETIPSKQRVI